MIQREVVGRLGRFDSQPAPDHVEKHNPEKTGVSLDRFERWGIPGVPIPEDTVADIAKGNERVVSEMPE